MQSITILKMSSSSPNTGKQASAPLVDGIVNHVLLHSGPDLNQSHSQLVHVLHFFSGMTRYCITPQILLFIGLRFGLFGGHRSGEMNAGDSRCSSLIVSRALCAGALSCWNISQGSVATHLRWGGIFINAQFQLSTSVKELWQEAKLSLG